MRDQEKIAEIENALQENKEKTEIYKQRFSNIQYEEDYFRDDFNRYTKTINGLSEVISGSMTENIQSEVRLSLNQLKNKVEMAFQDERDQLNRGMLDLDREKEELIHKKEKFEAGAE